MQIEPTDYQKHFQLLNLTEIKYIARIFQVLLTASFECVSVSIGFTSHQSQTLPESI